MKILNPFHIKLSTKSLKTISADTSALSTDLISGQKNLKFSLDAIFQGTHLLYSALKDDSLAWMSSVQETGKCSLHSPWKYVNLAFMYMGRGIKGEEKEKRRDEKMKELISFIFQATRLGELSGPFSTLWPTCSSSSQ
jgi:hypothetical protein